MSTEPNSSVEHEPGIEKTTSDPRQLGNSAPATSPVPDDSLRGEPADSGDTPGAASVPASSLPDSNTPDIDADTGEQPAGTTEAGTTEHGASLESGGGDDDAPAGEPVADIPLADVPDEVQAADALADSASADSASADSATVDSGRVAEASQDEADDEADEEEDVEPLELVTEEAEAEEEATMRWYILKVQVNREESIRDALQRRVKIEGLDDYFGSIVVPTEDVAEFTKSGKRRIVKKKLYPGYIMVNMVINDDTWFAVRETPGIGDFTGSAGKPTPMDTGEVERILNLGETDEDGDQQIKTSIPYSPGDRVRVKEGYFQNFEGDVESVDEANGRVTVMINIFGRSTPVELEHWQIESV